MKPPSAGPPPDDDAPPDAAWYERMRLRAEARRRGDVSMTAMAVAAPAPAVHPDKVLSSDGTVHAWQKVGRAIGDAATRVIEKVRWQRGRVYNPKILQADVKAAKHAIRPPPHWARNAVENFSAARVPDQDVSVPYFKAVVDVIETIASDGHGFVQRAIKSIGRLAGLGRMEGQWGRETVRKCIRWLEDHGWIGTLNALYRNDDRSLRRDANVYILFGKDDAAEAAGLEPETRATWRESRTLSRGAVIFSLAVRPWGLNATPAPSNRHQIRTRPAPA